MFRTRKPRWLKNERNLHNLHVIPTASNNTNLKLSDDETDPNVKHLPTPNVIQITPSDDSNNSNKSTFKQSKPISILESKINIEQKAKRQRRKPRKLPEVRSSVLVDNFNWYNSNCEDANPAPDKEAEKMEGACDAPGEENYFEEVEVASVEGEPRQEILVRFRKSKPFYLKYKKKGLFKPKIYKLAEPTFVNCLNIQDDDDVDVISEAEYEYETDCLERSDSQEILNTVLEVDESEVDSDQSDSQEINKIIEVDESGDGDQVEKDLEEKELGGDVDQVEKDLEVKELGGDSDQMENDSEGKESAGNMEKDSEGKESAGNIENDSEEKESASNMENDSEGKESAGNSDQMGKDLEGNKSRGDGSRVENEIMEVEARDNNENEIEIIDISGDDDDDLQVENKTILEDSTALKSNERLYKTCIKANNDFTQGASSIQNNLNLWKSHLIGLEYLVEIKSASHKDAEVKHYCVLCCEDLRTLEFPAISVINHINSNKHIVSYLEKHFPALGYKLAESGDCNIVLLQRLSEEISQSLGYYFMCITNSKYYAGNAQKIKEMIKNAYHPNEKDLKLDRNLFKSNLDSNIKAEVQSIISDIIQKIASPTEVRNPGSVVDNKNAVDHASIVKKPRKGPYFNTYKGCNPLSSYMQLNSFASSAFKKPGKKVSVRKSKKKLSTSTTGKSDGNVIKGLSTSTTEKSDEKVVKGLSTYTKDKNYEDVAKGLSTSIAEKSDGNIVKGLPTITKEKSYQKVVKGLFTSTKESPVGKDVEVLPTIAKEKSYQKVVEGLPTVTKGKRYQKVVKGLFTSTKETPVGKDVKGLPTITKEICVENSVKGLSSLNKVTCNKKDAETQNTSHGVDSGTTVANIGMSTPSQKVHRIKETILLKTSALHSKYCRKRILHKESSRLKLATKVTAKDEFVSGVSNKSRVKNKPVTVSVSCDTSKKVTEKIKEKLKLVKAIKNSSQKVNLINKFPFVQKSFVDSKSSVAKHSSPHHRIIHKKGVENSSTDQISVLGDFPSVWRPITRNSRSPGKSPTADSNRFVRSPDNKSNSPIRRNVRKHSKSPLQRIKSPLRHVTRQSFETLIGRYSRSPSRRHSRTPVRRKSRSPVKRKSRSPTRRKSRSPVRRKSRSPVRRKSRSPFWKSVRSPIRKKSRSPLRRYSRSPLKRRSRSPIRRRSRSPLRRRSRSPLRLHSRSPLRLRSRSPLRRRSRSPLRRRSRSPLRQHSRSPFRHLSRSPFRHLSRSPIKRRSRSPVGRHSRSPIRKYSEITKYRSDHSPDLGRDIRDRFNSEERFLSSVYNYDKQVSSRVSEFSKFSKDTSKMASSSNRNTSDKFKPHTFAHTSLRGISDLDPVSDEDESIYFNDKHQHTEEVNIPQSSKLMLTKLLQKFSMTDVSPSNPALNKLMQFMEAHSSEIQDLVGSQSKPGNMNVSKVDSSARERSLFLQQYLLSNLAGSSQEPTLPSPAENMQPKFMQTNIQPSFMQVAPGFGHPPNLPPANVSPQPVQQRFFPPNVNVPPPQLYQQPINQPRQDFSPKPNVPPEIMFKDLKATVNKLFGANKVALKQEKPQAAMLHLKPGYVTEPDPEKWDLNHPDTPKFNASVGSKNIFHSQGKNIEFNRIPQSANIQEEISMFSNNTTGQYFAGRGVNRSQIPSVPIPPPDAKVSFCEVSHSSKGNLFPVVNAHVNPNFNSRGSGVSDVKVSLAQRLASVLVKVGMIDVPAPLLQEMLMKIGAFSSSPRQDISETEIISILKRLGYL